MRKIVFALFVATVLVACNSGASTEAKVDSTAVSTPDTTVVKADSTVTTVDTAKAETK